MKSPQTIYLRQQCFCEICDPQARKKENHALSKVADIYINQSCFFCPHTGSLGLRGHADTWKERHFGSRADLGQRQEASATASITLPRGVLRPQMRNSFQSGYKFLEMQQRRAWSMLSGGFETEDMDTYEIVLECFSRLDLPRKCMHSLSGLSKGNKLFHQMDKTTLLHSSPGPYPGPRGRLQPFAPGFSGGSCPSYFLPLSESRRASICPCLGPRGQALP